MMARARGRAAFTAVAATCVALLGGCEVPTKVPTWTTNWEVQLDSSDVKARSFLPANIVDNPADTTFVVNVAAPAFVQSTLGSICGASCSAVATVPIPAFNNTGAPVTGSFTLPASVVSATLKGGTVPVAITNNFSFDPLRPNGALAPFGLLRIVITSGAVTVADTTLSGGSFALPAGGTNTVNILLRSVVVTGTLAYAVTVNSPGSTSTASINPAHTFRVQPSVTPGSLKVRQASVTVTSQSFNDSSNVIDLSNVSFDATQLKGAAFAIRVSNPFTIGGNLSFSLTAPGVPTVVKAATLSPAPAAGTPGNSVINVSYTAGEFAPFLGRNGVRARFSGTVGATGPGNSVILVPGQIVTLRTSVKAALNIVQP